jgi:hypothetical protein
MKRRGREFYYFIVDSDKMLFNCLGPISSDLELNNKVVAAIESGREIRASSTPDLNSKEEHIDFYKSKGYKLIEDLLIDKPIDRSNEYTKRLPDYAKNADRNKIVCFFCDNCKSNVFGEMTINYPGQEILTDSKLFSFEARCLKCGAIVSDHYNWYR